MRKKIYTLLFSYGEKNRRACQSLMRYNIPCEFLASSDADGGPILLVPGPAEIRGLEKIVEFVNTIKSNYINKEKNKVIK